MLPPFGAEVVALARAAISAVEATYQQLKEKNMGYINAEQLALVNVERAKVGKAPLSGVMVNEILSKALPAQRRAESTDAFLLSVELGIPPEETFTEGGTSDDSSTASQPPEGSESSSDENSSSGDTTSGNTSSPAAATEASATQGE